MTCARSDGQSADEVRAFARRAIADMIGLKDDELIIVLGKVQPDRFSGGMRLTVQQVWDLAAARCRFGKYLRVEVNGHVPPVAEVLRDFPARRVAGEHGEVTQGVAVRLRLQRQHASAELDPGDGARF